MAVFAEESLEFVVVVAAVEFLGGSLNKEYIAGNWRATVDEPENYKGQCPVVACHWQEVDHDAADSQENRGPGLGVVSQDEETGKFVDKHLVESDPYVCRVPMQIISLNSPSIHAKLAYPSVIIFVKHTDKRTNANFQFIRLARDIIHLCTVNWGGLSSGYESSGIHRALSRSARSETIGKC